MHNLPEFPNGIFLGYELKRADVKAEQYLNKNTLLTTKTNKYTEAT